MRDVAIPCVSALHGRHDPAVSENSPLTSVLSSALVYGHHCAFHDAEVLILRRLKTLSVDVTRHAASLRHPFRPISSKFFNGTFQQLRLAW